MLKIDFLHDRVERQRFARIEFALWVIDLICFGS